MFSKFKVGGRFVTLALDLEKADKNYFVEH